MMEREKYESPEMETIQLDVEDIITDSPPDPYDDQFDG